MPPSKKHGKYSGQILLESEEEIVLPEKKEDRKRYYILLKDGKEYKAHASWRSMKATFKIYFKTFLLLDFEYTVLIQFVGERHIFVNFEYADLYQVHRWLTSSLQLRLKLKKISRIPSDLTMMLDRWRLNRDFLIFKFKHNPAETLELLELDLPKLITVMSLRRIPREFDEQFKFTFGID